MGEHLSMANRDMSTHSLSDPYCLFPWLATVLSPSYHSSMIISLDRSGSFESRHHLISFVLGLWRSSAIFTLSLIVFSSKHCRMFRPGGCLSFSSDHPFSSADFNDLQRVQGWAIHRHPHAIGADTHQPRHTPLEALEELHIPLGYVSSTLDEEL